MSVRIDCDCVPLVTQAAPRQARQPFQPDAATFERLLDFVGADQPARRAERYRLLREKVESFFRWKGLVDPAGLTDETFDRVARRVEANEVRTAQPHAFILGVARMVALEAARRDRREVPLEEHASEPVPANDDDVEVRLKALDGCLEGLLPAERELVFTYYRDEGSTRIEGRQRLADSLGTTVGALRVRAFRIRARLESCVQSKLESGQK